jgi:DNA-binding beta-propeller fold protein YncE
MSVKARILMVALSCALILGACTAPASQSAPTFTANELLILLPNAHKLAMYDPTTNKVTGQVDLGGFAMDYARAPNGKVYIPLQGTPGHPQALIAVLDGRTGKIATIKSPAGGLDFITITKDGTAFIRSGLVTERGSTVVVLDTNTDKILGTVGLPGAVQRLVALSDTEAMVPVTLQPGGNVYVIDKSLGNLKPLFPFKLEPFAPGQIIMKPNARIMYAMYSGLPAAAQERRQQLKPLISDERLLETHIDVWDLSTFKLVRRIFLTIPSAQNMVLAPDGLLYVGHLDMSGTSPIAKISAVNPESGAIKEIDTVKNPISLGIHKQHLYIASHDQPVVEWLALDGTGATGRITLDGVPALAPLSD